MRTFGFGMLIAVMLVTVYSVHKAPLFDFDRALEACEKAGGIAMSSDGTRRVYICRDAAGVEIAAYPASDIVAAVEG